MILPSQQIAALIDAGQIRLGDGAGEHGDLPQTLQPASLDLTLGRRAYRMRASFLPGRTGKVQDGIDALCLHRIDLDGGAVLETGCIYL
ncbi:MAG: 2'-deoxycytidine 5'-triphosphate deaminase, partial [Pseudomonadota bacterium]